MALLGLIQKLGLYIILRLGLDIVLSFVDDGHFFIRVLVIGKLLTVVRIFLLLLLFVVLFSLETRLDLEGSVRDKVVATTTLALGQHGALSLKLHVERGILIQNAVCLLILECLLFSVFLLGFILAFQTIFLKFIGLFLFALLRIALFLAVLLLNLDTVFFNLTLLVKFVSEDLFFPFLLPFLLLLSLPVRFQASMGQIFPIVLLLLLVQLLPSLPHWLLLRSTQWNPGRLLHKIISLVILAVLGLLVPVSFVLAVSLTARLFQQRLLLVSLGSFALRCQFIVSLVRLTKNIFQLIDFVRARVKVLDMVVVATGGDFSFLMEALMVLGHSHIWANIVKVVHLLTLVVLKKAFVGAQMLLILGVEAVCNLVEHLRRDLVQHVFTIGFAKIVHVVAATLSQSQESN